MKDSDRKSIVKAKELVSLTFLRLFSLVLTLWIPAAQAQVQPFCSGRAAVLSAGNLPVCSNLDFNQTSSEVEMVVVYVHGIGGNAQSVFADIDATIKTLPGRANKTLILAPQFQVVARTTLIPAGVLAWLSFPFWGEKSDALVGEQNTSVTITPFAALDELLKTATDKTKFPNLSQVVIAGFSGGGQMVQRYAAVNQFSSSVAVAQNLAVRFIVAAPSSYLYFSDQRRIGSTTDNFAVPSTSEISACPEYNRYGSGLEQVDTFDYIRQSSSEQISTRYSAAQVRYLVGSLDSNPADSSLDKACYAALQGNNRLERFTTFQNHILGTFGQAIDVNHSFRVVDQVGHSSSQLIGSPAAVEFLTKNDQPQGVVTPTPASTPPIIVPSPVVTSTPSEAVPTESAASNPAATPTQVSQDGQPIVPNLPFGLVPPRDKKELNKQIKFFLKITNQIRRKTRSVDALEELQRGLDQMAMTNNQLRIISKGGRIARASKLTGKARAASANRTVFVSSLKKLRLVLLKISNSSA
jgi:hypothetical protein